MKRDRAKLDAILREVREDLVPPRRAADGDFSNVDAKLFARIAQEQASPAAERAPARVFWRSGYFWGGTAFIAAAAAAVFMIRQPASSSGAEGSLAQTTPSASSASGGADRDPSDPSGAADPARAGSLELEHQAASFDMREGRGDIRIGGSVVEPGHALAASESVETTDARAMFVSGLPSSRADGRPAVTWLLEERSHVDVRHVRMPLTLALSTGAVEAQVAPVDHGEAFAVDIDGVRVAVHGTHLRVSREGGHVTVDLTEGVVAIGAVPKSGLTEGTVVTAPAHVEFDTADLAASLHIDPTAASVRAAVPLTARTDLRMDGAGARPASRDGRDARDARDGTALDKAAGARSANGASSGNAPAVRPEDVIAKGVRACVATQLREATVRVTVSSKLSLKIAEDGSVQFARFNPPLAPEAQECASRIIYKTRFPRGGTIEIPLSSE